jgi:hypothetical protein
LSVSHTAIMKRRNKYSHTLNSQLNVRLNMGLHIKNCKSSSL